MANRGVNIGSVLMGAVKGGFANTPIGGSLMGAFGALTGGGGAATTSTGAPRRRRSRTMFVRKGRIFMGFTQKDVRAAMKRTYHARSK